MRRPLPVAQGKGMDMFRLSVKPRKVADKDVFRVSPLVPHQPIYTLQVLSPLTVSPGDHPGLRGSASGLAGER